MEYIGEHTLLGNLGKLAVVVAFVAALVAAISNFMHVRSKETHWISLARVAFKVHGVAVLGIVVSLFAIIYNHYFEYSYAWEHSSKDLPTYYMISSFWEGQEGSFILWTFWHVVLGLILMRSAKSWEAPTMTVVSLVQIFLTSMLLGVYIFGAKIGSSPFTLLRELPDNLDLPWTKIADYLTNPQTASFFADGSGLNPLLQNYWMVIHPPTLFLGFASTLIPFAFAIAGLWTKRYNEWLKPAMPWAFFGVMILGTGILMGGAWAYEALSFGGFWAWDPVENSSLVPWLTFVGAAHLMLIQKNKGGTLLWAFFLNLLTFILILYSTFLTRSGVLGDTSVHAFVDLGLNGQLLIYLLFFVALSLVLFISRYKQIPRAKKEDDIWSREFWMFIGSLVLLISSFQITFTTSIPVLNKMNIVSVLNPIRSLFGLEKLENLAPPIEAIAHYNSWQVPFAIIITLLVAIGQYFNYKKTDFNKFIKKIGLSFIVSVLLTFGLAFLSGMTSNPIYIALLFSTVFAVVANLNYWIAFLKGKWRFAGPSIAHIGFAMIMMGALISNGKQDIISTNEEYIAKDFPQNENILLEQGDTVQMGDYFVTYTGRRKDKHNRYFTVEYFKLQKNGNLNKAFTLEPFIQINEQMGNVNEPSTKHYLEKDIYTHLTYADVQEKIDGKYSREATVELDKDGGQAIYEDNILTLDSLTVDNVYNKVVLVAHITIAKTSGEKYPVKPVYILELENNIASHIDAESKETNLRVRFNNVITETGKMEIKVWKDTSDEKDFIVMKAIVFPYINILWIGSILLIIGTLIAMYNRIKR